MVWLCKIILKQHWVCEKCLPAAAKLGVLKQVKSCDLKETDTRRTFKKDLTCKFLLALLSCEFTVGQ